MLRQLWKNTSKNPAVRNAARPAARRPVLEALEDRCVPTAYTWVGPAGGLWSNPANWSSALPGTTPGVGSDVVYNSSAGSNDDLTIPSPGLNSLLIGTSAGTLTISGSLQQSPGTFINQEGGTVLVSGLLVNGGGYNQFAGTLNVSDVVTNTGAYDLYAGSVVGAGKFLNGASGQQGNLLISTPTSATVGVNLENFSQITWSSGNITLQGTLTNFSGGTIAVNTPATLSGPGYLVNNYGASITASTGGTATVDVLMGASDTNYGLINVTKGGLVFGLFTQLTNEGRIGASVAGSGSSVTFDGPYQQLTNTQKSSYTPLAASFAGDTLTFQQGAVVNAGTVSVLGTANVNGPIFGSTLVVNPGGTVSVGGTLNMTGWVSDSGVMWISGGTVNLSAFGQFNVNAGGTLNAVSPSANQKCAITGGIVFDYGTVTVYNNSTLAVTGSYTQLAGGLTDLNGFLDYTSFNVLTSLPAVLQVSQGIDVAGGEFLITNAYVETSGSGFYLEANATLVFQNSSGLGSGYFVGNATILGAMNLENQYGTNIGFANNLTLGSASVSMTITMNLFDNITIGGVTNFANCTVAFNNVAPSGSVPYLYEPFDFATAPVVGTPNIPLPAGDSWWITYNQNQGWMQVKILM